MGVQVEVAGGQALYRDAALRGVVAGLLAGTVQPVVGWVLDQTLLPPGQDSNIAPRLVNRTARKAGHRTSAVVDWLGGVLFHYGYGAGLGAFFGVLKRWSGLPTPALSVFLGWLIYLAAFSGIGAGTSTGTEQRPDRRPWQKQVSLVAVAFAFALSLGPAFDRLDPRRRA